MPPKRSHLPWLLQIATHSCIPYALAWGHCIMAAGNDGGVVFYDAGGKNLQSVNLSTDDVADFSSAAFNPTGDCVVLGTFNKFYTFALNTRRNVWEQVGLS